MGGTKASAVSLLAGFRARKLRPHVLALLACLCVAQTLLIVHRIGHASAGHDVACALCVGADHAAGPIAQPIQAIAHSRPAPVASRIVKRARALILVPSYRSRAPPAHLRS